MTASKILLYFCLSFIGGIFLNSVIQIPQLLMLVFLIFGTILISIPPSLHFRKRAGFVVIGFCLLFLVVGVWHHQMALLEIENNELRKFNDLGEELTLFGVVSKEPDIREKIIKLKIENLKAKSTSSSSSPSLPQMEARKLKIDEGWNDVSAAVLVTTSRYPEYGYGDKLKITGKLETPPVYEDFNYKDYLAKDGIYSIVNFPKIELIGSGFGNPLIRAIFSLKNKFKTAARSFISPPQEGILEALIFGEEGRISNEWKDKLNFTGTRHIAAVSGMNITIITFLIFAFALSLGFWRNQAIYLTIFLLFLYILMIGAPASAVRAGIMAALFLAAQCFGRLSSGLRPVIFAATFMLAQNPLLLRLDVGFQLSFLAILGMIYLQPAFSGRFFSKIPNPQIFPIRTTLSATLAAQIFTLPILIYNFGYVSLISPIANILIVPFLALITILIFLFGISAILFWPLGFLLSLPTWLFLTYIVGIIDWFSKLPFAHLSIENVHWVWLFLLYLILGLITWQLQERQKLKFLNY